VWRSVVRPVAVGIFPTFQRELADPSGHKQKLNLVKQPDRLHGQGCVHLTVSDESATVAGSAAKPFDAARGLSQETS
jgi:hypothetical protein